MLQLAALSTMHYSTAAEALSRWESPDSKSHIGWYQIPSEQFVNDNTQGHVIQHGTAAPSPTVTTHSRQPIYVASVSTADCPLPTEMKYPDVHAIPHSAGPSTRSSYRRARHGSVGNSQRPPALDRNLYRVNAAKFSAAAEGSSLRRKNSDVLRARELSTFGAASRPTPNSSACPAHGYDQKLSLSHAVDRTEVEYRV